MSRADDIGNYPANPADPSTHGYCGLTIRQAYKIAAMEGMLANPSVECSNESISKYSGEIADMMLAEDSAHEAAMTKEPT